MTRHFPDHTITHRNGWTIYSDQHGTIAIRGRYNTRDEIPDLATMNPRRYFVVS